MSIKSVIKSFVTNACQFSNKSSLEAVHKSLLAEVMVPKEIKEEKNLVLSQKDLLVLGEFKYQQKFDSSRVLYGLHYNFLSFYYGKALK